MEPIPLSLVRAGRDLTEPEVSPDRSWVGFVQRWRGGSSINAVPVAGPGLERQLTYGPDPAPGRGLGGGCFTWVIRSGAGPSLAYAAVDGELWWQDGLRLERLTSLGRSVRAPAVSDQSLRPIDDMDHGHLVFAVDEAEVWIVELDSGASRRLDDGRHEFCFDPVMSPDERIVSWQGWSPPDMPWDGSVRVDLDLKSGALNEWRLPDAAVQQPRFTPHGEPVHVHDASGWLNVHVGDRPVVLEQLEHAGPTWGMGVRSYAFDDRGDRMAFTRNEAGHGALCVVDLETGVVDQVGRGVHGHLSWVGDNLVAIRAGARTPTQVVSYSAPRLTRTTIAMSQPDVWDTAMLPEPELIEVAARDGLTLHARRFVAGQQRLLVWIHGGPTDQWQVDWRPRFTYWWSRGWDVLVVDPRGTTGHGRAFQQALRGSWGRADVDDTADLIAHAHEAGWAEPSTTVVIGGSSGGLTVLGVLVDHDHLVAGGVASYPVSDLKALTEATHRFEAHYTDSLVAPNDGSAESEARFRDLSPGTRAEQITASLLLFHGTDDEVVPIEQSDAFAAHLTGAGGDLSYVVYEGEGHGFRDPKNIADEFERVENFLERVTSR